MSRGKHIGRRALLALLADGEWTKTQLVTETGLGRKRLKHLLDDLVDSGCVRRLEPRRLKPGEAPERSYQITDKGR